MPWWRCEQQLVDPFRGKGAFFSLSQWKTLCNNDCPCSRHQWSGQDRCNNQKWSNISRSVTNDRPSVPLGEKEQKKKRNSAPISWQVPKFRYQMHDCSLVLRPAELTRFLSVVEGEEFVLELELARLDSVTGRNESPDHMIYAQNDRMRNGCNPICNWSADPADFYSLANHDYLSFSHDKTLFFSLMCIPFGLVH